MPCNKSLWLHNASSHERDLNHSCSLKYTIYLYSNFLFSHHAKLKSLLLLSQMSCLSLTSLDQTKGSLILRWLIQFQRKCFIAYYNIQTLQLSLSQERREKSTLFYEVATCWNMLYIFQNIYMKREKLLNINQPKITNRIECTKFFQFHEQKHSLFPNNCIPNL